MSEIDPEETVESLMKEIEHDMEVAKEKFNEQFQVETKDSNILFNALKNEDTNLNTINEDDNNDESELFIPLHDTSREPLCELKSPLRMNNSNSVPSIHSSPLRMKQMIEEHYGADDRTLQTFSPTKDILYIMKGTKPLLSSSTSNGQLISELELNILNDDDSDPSYLLENNSNLMDEDDDVSFIERSPQRIHFPSKIPIINTMTINTFSKSNLEDENDVNSSGIADSSYSIDIDDNNSDNHVHLVTKKYKLGNQECNNDMTSLEEIQNHSISTQHSPTMSAYVEELDILDTSSLHISNVGDNELLNEHITSDNSILPNIASDLPRLSSPHDERREEEENCAYLSGPEFVDTLIDCVSIVASKDEEEKLEYGYNSGPDFNDRMINTVDIISTGSIEENKTESVFLMDNDHELKIKTKRTNLSLSNDIDKLAVNSEIDNPDINEPKIEVKIAENNQSLRYLQKSEEQDIIDLERKPEKKQVKIPKLVKNYLEKINFEDRKQSKIKEILQDEEFPKQKAIRTPVPKVEERKTTPLLQFNTTFSPLLPVIPVLEKLIQDDPFSEPVPHETALPPYPNSKFSKVTPPTTYIHIWHQQESYPPLTNPTSITSKRTISPTSSYNSNFSQVSSASTKLTVGSTVNTSNNNYAASPPLTPTIHQSLTATNFKFKPKLATRPRRIMLDPMRRNTIKSKKIQERINESKSFKPNLSYPERFYEEQDYSIGDDIYEKEEEEEEEESSHAAILQNLKPKNFKVWNEYFNKDHEDDGVNKYDSIAPEVIQKLLKDESFLDGDYDDNTLAVAHSIKGREYEDKNKSADMNLNIGLGILRTPVKCVSVDEGLSFKGYEPSISDNDDYENSKNNNDNAVEMSIHTPKSNSINGDIHSFERMNPSQNHIHSPFKVVSPKKNSKGMNVSQDIISLREENQEINTIHDDDIAAPAQTKENDKTKDAFDECTSKEIGKRNKDEATAEMTDLGVLYVTIKKITNIRLSNILQHKGKYCIEFDNGTNMFTTPWEIMPSDGNLMFGKEFEIPLKLDRETMKPLDIELQITLKIKYMKLENELVEIVEKVPIAKKKKLPFAKTKYQMIKRYVSRPTRYDDWGNLFAEDGSFGQTKVRINETNLKRCEFIKCNENFDMINRWAKGLTSKDSAGGYHPIHVPSRAPPYSIGNIELEMCYLKRSSSLERFPKSLDLAQDILKKIREQESINKEGYLLQEGGDVTGIFQRRYFKLNGIEMIGYHEITQEPKVNINLLKVIDVINIDDTVTEANKRIFTDSVLMGECFQLVFDDGEIITFNVEANYKERKDWYRKIKKVVELNTLRQPWIKQFNENSKIEKIFR
ncbi:Bud4p NDAI_0D00540 [Naumovozyma dairenensis CBS 421]|uniref:PH domain-containing protein n=1 Tax=Naumovozyma dairenensis (strain ATCC 10597 / BCRC 20456 / CBS 421 / NBRC 0211 / NRRL Y-12639) TaxID=1071378 RepID=G0W9A7_NAUDC|nr:hypothetical protein NDAI_0D00540 [Naumovozyma dairenensis CBS 421]CCD24368.1 hypothetical protein NDAI_0D00540 [Naumovozyma dairenensis CBS 421]